jgi:DNA polymerase-3 subunit delta'
MSFQSVPGQEQPQKMLKNSLLLNRLAHAYIFSGLPGTGRKRMAMAFAKAVFCTEQADDSCGHCLACRKVEHGNHPDLHWIEPTGASIKIEQIRELQKQLAYKSTVSGMKIYIIDQVERMTVQAANSLLKFLEEPQSPIIAILITDNGQALLPTIQSRAQTIPFAPLDPAWMKQELTGQGLSSELAGAAVHLAAGLEAAKELAQANWFAETRSIVIQLIKESLEQAPAALITIQRKVMKAEAADHIEVLFDLLILLLKDLIYYSCNEKTRIIFTDQLDFIQRVAFTRESVFWVECIATAVELQKRLRFHANPQLVLEQMIMYVQGGLVCTR